MQIEYALNAVAAGATSLGITATDGVVIATEKKLPSVLVDEATVQKIASLTPNIGVASPTPRPKRANCEKSKAGNPTQ